MKKEKSMFRVRGILVGLLVAGLAMLMVPSDALACAAGHIQPQDGPSCGWHVATTCQGKCSPWPRPGQGRTLSADTAAECLDACYQCCDNWADLDEEILEFAASSVCTCIANLGSPVACIGQFAAPILRRLGFGDAADLADIALSLGGGIRNLRRIARTPSPGEAVDHWLDVWREVSWRRNRWGQLVPSWTRSGRYMGPEDFAMFQEMGDNFWRMGLDVTQAVHRTATISALRILASGMNQLSSIEETCADAAEGLYDSTCHADCEETWFGGFDETTEDEDEEEEGDGDSEREDRPGGRGGRNGSGGGGISGGGTQTFCRTTSTYVPGQGTEVEVCEAWLNPETGEWESRDCTTSTNNPGHWEVDPCGEIGGGGGSPGLACNCAMEDFICRLSCAF